MVHKFFDELLKSYYKLDTFSYYFLLHNYLFMMIEEMSYFLTRKLCNLTAQASFKHLRVESINQAVNINHSLRRQTKTA